MSVFDLSVDIPIRGVVDLGGGRGVVVVLVLHHVACDGWSMAPLFEDLSAAYTRGGLVRCRAVAGVAGAVRGLRVVAA